MRYEVSSGQVSNGITLWNYDYMRVLNGGLVRDTTVSSGGQMRVSSGGTALYIKENGGYVSVESGANVTFVKNSFSGLVVHFFDQAATIHSGTTANSTTINHGGRLYVSSGGTANSTTVNDNGSMYVSSGGTANDTTVNNWGCMYVSSGGIANSTTVDAYLFISSGGIANSATVNINGIMYVSSGGTANETTINANGRMYVLSGGTALDIKENGGYVHVLDGAAVTFVKNSFSGLVLSNGVAGATIHSGTTANSTTINSYGCMFVSSGGTANSTTVNDNGSMYVSSGGTANETTVNRNGKMHVSFGGTANETTVNSAGEMYVSTGGTANDTTVNNWGYMYVSSGGTVNDTTVNNWGYMYVSSGGTATGITAMAGARLGITVAPDTFIQGTSDGSAFVMQNAYLAGYVVSSYNGIFISSGGTATDITAMDGARLIITVAPDTFIQGTSNGSAFVMQNAYLSGYTVNNNGSIYVSSDGTASDTTVNNGGYMYVSSGGTATDITAMDGARLIITVAPDTFIQGTSNGSAFVMQNAYLSGYTINNDGSIYVSSGGTASDTTVNDNGSMYVSSGGTANETTVNTWGYLYVFSGGTANDTTVNSGGWMYVSSGGIASNTTVYSGGWMYVSSGGTANETTVNSGGRMFVSSGGTLSGTLQIESGARVSSYSGAIIDFTVADQTDPATALINNWSRISGGNNADYTLTVKADQEYGSYLLAGGATDFDQTITVKTTDGEQLGTLAVGETLTQEKVTYSLEKQDGNLLMAVKKVLTSLTITAESADKTYDGEALTAGYSYTGKLAEGDELLVTVEGSQTDVGSSANAIADYQIKHDGVDVTGNYSVTTIDGTLTVNRAAAPQLRRVDTTGGTTTLHWIPSSQNEATDVALSKPDSADEKLEVRTAAQSLDLYSTPEKLDLSLKNTDSSNWSRPIGLPQTSTGNATAIVANADGTADLFFANFKGIWDEDFVAGHVGSREDWEGTGEEVSLAGKNRSMDTFTGSADANVLVMTDSANGDALFVDDVFSAFPDQQQSRLANIHTVLAGAGDDVVDLTSQQFEYTGNGLTVRGGDGSDTIWANKGNNLLFGDAGDDRLVGASGDDVLSGGSGNDSLHGGGGSDVFCFSASWGVDTVEQLANGSVTLWFADGDLSHWNASTLTYADGDNRVTVSGVTADQISLKFGNDGSAQYGKLAAAGAFLEATSGKIFTDQRSGVIVAL